MLEIGIKLSAVKFFKKKFYHLSKLNIIQKVGFNQTADSYFGKFRKVCLICSALEIKMK